MNAVHFDDLRIFAMPGTVQEANRRHQIEQFIAKRTTTRAIFEAIPAATSCGGISSTAYSVLAEWASVGPIIWGREVGHLCRANVLGEQNSIAGALVATAIQASLSGVAGDWCFNLVRPISTRVHGSVLNAMRSGRIFSDGYLLRGKFELDSGSIELEANRTEILQIESTSPHLIAPRIDIDNDNYHILPSALASPDLISPDAKSSYAGSESSADAAETVRGGLDLIYSVSSDIYSWVSTVIREIVPLYAPSGNPGSSSSMWNCGIAGITVSNLENALLVSEMLVHEASHHHFFFAKQISELDTGSDECSYFSPMANANRPLDKMFLGYHALINILSFYSVLRESLQGSEDEYFLRRRINYLLRKLEIIRPTIDHSPSFTEAGDEIRVNLLKHDGQLCDLLNY